MLLKIIWIINDFYYYLSNKINNIGMVWIQINFFINLDLPRVSFMIFPYEKLCFIS